MLLRPHRFRAKTPNVFFNVRPTLIRRLIRKFGYEDAKQQLKWIQKEVLNRPPALSKPPESGSFDPVIKSSVTGLLYRLLRDEPLAYVLGTQPFGSLVLRVSAPVLIPRMETEEWTMELLKRINTEILSQSSSRDTPPLQSHHEAKEWKILDLCTGSGCIPLLLCNEWPHRARYMERRVDAQQKSSEERIVVYAVDIAEESVHLAQVNAKDNFGSESVHLHTPGIPPQATCNEDANAASETSVDRPPVTFNIWKLDVFDPSFQDWLITHGPFDVITCNPPYIPDRECEEELPRSVTAFEDHRALRGGEDGLRFYRRLAELLNTAGQSMGGGNAGTKRILHSGGFMALEFGKGQGQAVADILRKCVVLKDLELWTDAFGVERTIFCRTL